MNLKPKYKVWNASLKRFEISPWDDHRTAKESQKDPYEQYFIDPHKGELLISIEKGDYHSDIHYEAPKDEIHLLQYIGKLDSNGFEICEADIILLEGEYYSNYWEVVWKERMCGFEFILRGMESDNQYPANF